MTYKPIFNHTAIKAQKAQEQKEKTVSALLAIGTTVLFIIRPFVLGEF